MKIEKLYFTKYKNLENVSLVFNDMTKKYIIIGNNGAGKTNLIEALILIIKHMNNPNVNRLDFNYEITYTHNSHKISIEKDGDILVVNVNGFRNEYNPISRYKKYMDYIEVNEILPENIFVFGSGDSKRLYNTIRVNSNTTMKSRILLVDGFESKKQLLLNFKSTDELRVKSLVFHYKESLLEYNDNNDNLTKFIKYIEEDREKQKREDEKIVHNTISITLDDLNTIAEIKDNEHFEEFLNDINKYLSDFSATRRSSIDIVISRKNNEIQFNDLGEGEQMMHVINSLLSGQKYNESTIIFDEPDSNFNPRKINDLAEVFNDNESHYQLFISTHSASLISRLNGFEQMLIHNNEIRFEKLRYKSVNSVLSRYMDFGNYPDNIWRKFEVAYKANDDYEYALVESIYAELTESLPLDDLEMVNLKTIINLNNALRDIIDD